MYILINKRMAIINLMSQIIIIRGKIELILGPMFSGKSSELFRRVQRHSLAKRKCIIGKYSKDPR